MRRSIIEGVTGWHPNTAKAGIYSRSRRLKRWRFCLCRYHVRQSMPPSALGVQVVLDD